MVTGFLPHVGPAGARLRKAGSAVPGRLAVFAVTFAILITVLLVRNRALFSVAVNETGDSAANSIITLQAKHLHLLVGNYSRLGFSHPGPAFFYVQALGEWLCHDLLGIAASPWSGQVLAILALNAALLATTLSVLAGWCRSWLSVALATGAALGYVAGGHAPLLSSAWMPFMYVAPFLLLLTAGASVAAGRTGDLWALALAAGLLVHGHAEFLAFVPLLAGTALAALLLPARHRGGLAALLRTRRRDWLLAAGVAALFAAPIVANLLLHWPGEFGKYLSYGSSSRAGGHSLGAAAGYTLSFWPGPAGTTPAVATAAVATAVAAAVAVALVTAVVTLARRQATPAPRRFLLAGAAAATLATIAFTGYAARGIDDLGQSYVGYFSYAIPLLLVLLLAAGVGTLRPSGSGSAPAAARGPGVALAAACLTAVCLTAGVAAAAYSPALLTPREQIDAMPQALDVLAARSGGRPVVLELEHDAWPELDALIIAGARHGLRVCAHDPSWRYMVTADFVCSRSDLETGTTYQLSLRAHARADATLVADLGRSVLTTLA